MKLIILKILNKNIIIHPFIRPFVRSFMNSSIGSSIVSSIDSSIVSSIVSSIDLSQLLQLIEKKIDAVDNNELKIKTAKTIMNICEKRIVQDELNKQTNHYKTRLESISIFNKNETLAKLIKNLSVTEFKHEEIQINDTTFDMIEINFGTFNVCMSCFDTHHCNLSYRSLCRNNGKYEKEYDIEVERDVECFYDKIDIDCPFELFDEFINAIIEIRGEEF